MGPREMRIGSGEGSPDIIRVINSKRLRWAGYVARMEDDRRSSRIVTGKPIGKRSLGRLNRR